MSSWGEDPRSCAEHWNSISPLQRLYVSHPCCNSSTVVNHDVQQGILGLPKSLGCTAQCLSSSFFAKFPVGHTSTPWAWEISRPSVVKFVINYRKPRNEATLAINGVKDVTAISLSHPKHWDLLLKIKLWSLRTFGTSCYHLIPVMLELLSSGC